MDEKRLARRFEESRGHLRRVAQRMLGSGSEADDAVQEAWLRVSRADAEAVDNLGGWLTTVVARICLDVLRARVPRREAQAALRDSADVAPVRDPETAAMLADAVGPALLVVLETLAPVERVAFVLHDMFDVPFGEIASIINRTPAATRQLASRARRRVQGKPVPAGELERHREIVGAFLTASREGNFETLLAVLDPDAVVRADELAAQTAAANQWPDLASEIHGARAVATTLSGRARGLQRALIDGEPGAVWLYAGQTRSAWQLTVAGGKVLEVELVMDPGNLARLQIAIEG